MAELTLNVSSPEGMLVTKAGSKSCKLPFSEDTGISSQIPKAVYIRYRDHAFFKNVKTPAAKAIKREVLGWVKEENDEVILIECDRPLLRRHRSGFNGVVIIKSCIVSMEPLNFEHILNSQDPLLKNRVCASSQRSEKLTPKNKRKGQN